MTTQTQAVGFYVTVRNRAKVGFLLGPYDSHDEALANVDRAREYVREHRTDMWFDDYGTARATAKPGRELKPGKLNEVIGLAADTAG